jgi:uncharacterized protein (TIGR02058 family)
MLQWQRSLNRAFCRASRTRPDSFFRCTFSSWNNSSTTDRPVWTQEWKELGLGCSLVDDIVITNLFFVQMGFGVDQHGDANATKAALRALRNAIEFNSIPGVIEAIPGGRKEMLIHVKLGIPASNSNTTSDGPLEPMLVDPLEVAKVFPYGRLLPVEMVVGGLSFSTGRLVPELGDSDDMAICVNACVSIGYNDGTTSPPASSMTHTVHSTRDGL